MAMISLVDEKRQWFKARTGIRMTQTARDISFCAHTINQRDLFIVPDARQDERFLDSPLVTGEPGICFYAGAPLVSPADATLGALCVMDHLPRTLTREQEQALRILARQAMTHLELHRQARDLIESDRELLLAREELERIVQSRTLDLQRVEESARLMASLAENSTEFIGIAGPEDRLMFLNPAGRRLVGMDPDEDVSIYNRRDLHPAEESQLTDEINSLLDREGHWAGERCMRSFKTNAKILVFQNIFRLTEERTGRQLTASIARDISELKRAEESLRKVQAELAHVTRVTTMGELAASIAHEVNQPIGGIVINGNAALRWLAGVKSDSVNLVEAKEALQRIIRDGQRAGEVVARIRSLFKKEETAKLPLGMNGVIQEIVILSRNEMDKKKILLRMNLAADLPPVLGNRVQLQQVMLNLILNSIDAMSAVEGRSRELIIGTEVKGEAEVLVTVRDTGIGFDPAKIKQIFDAFHTTKPGGLGMGLSISRSIVENHCGQLWGTVNEGPGASFHFTLLAYRPALEG